VQTVDASVQSQKETLHVTVQVDDYRGSSEATG
jgi:hypothetical protein